jgi:capsular exopolysaccharide synthesis family protein
MSRLFDALRGAKGFREAEEGNAGEGLWEALGINGTDAPPSLNDPDSSDQAGTPVSERPEKTHHDEEQLIHRLKGSIATSIHTAVDPTAHLIPHAVNVVIAEHYRRLRTKILQQQAEKPFKSVVVTSASPQEGKTVTVLNLGLSFAMLPSCRVLVVDGDLRKGTLGHWLGVDDTHQGLSNLIDGSAQLEDVLLRSNEIPMHFIVRGNSQVTDLHDSQLDVHFRKMTEQYDLVLVDTPPVNLIADVQLLAGCCDAVLLIARAFSTTAKMFERAVQELAPFRIIGTVLNAGMEPSARYRGDYY